MVTCSSASGRCFQYSTDNGSIFQFRCSKTYVEGCIIQEVVSSHTQDGWHAATDIEAFESYILYADMVHVGDSLSVNPCGAVSVLQ
jgi:hypothetical protein